MAVSKCYRPSVDYTVADQVEVTASPTNSKNAFIPGTKLVDATNTAIGTAGNPLVTSGTGGGSAMTQAEFIAALKSGTGTTTSTNSGTSPVTVLASNAARKGASVSNTDANILYLLLGTGTVSATNFTVALGAGNTNPTYYEAPFGFTGIITGLWASDGSGVALATEYT